MQELFGLENASTLSDIAKDPTKATLVRDELFYRVARRYFAEGVTAAMAEVHRHDKTINEREYVNKFVYNVSFVKPIDESFEYRPAQCMRCLFRNYCSYKYIYMSAVAHTRQMRCGSFISDTTPEWNINLRMHLIRKYDMFQLTYNCGFYGYETDPISETGPFEREKVNRGSINEFLTKIRTFIVEQTAAGIPANIVDIYDLPFNVNTFIKYKVRPKFNEQYNDYCKRVDAVVKKIRDRFEETAKEKTEEQSKLDLLRDIFVALGHGDTLADSFGGDVETMASIFFPGKSIDMILLHYKSVASNAKAEQITPTTIYKEIING